MKSFSASDAAVTGFRVAREQPKVIALWAVAHLVMTLASAAAMLTLGGEAMTQFMSVAQTPNPDPMAIMALYAKLAPMYGVIILLMITYYSVSSRPPTGSCCGLQSPRSAICVWARPRVGSLSSALS